MKPTAVNWDPFDNPVAAKPGVDPKGAAGSAKVPLAVIPPAVLLELGAAMGEGAIKYGPHNWRSSGGVVASTYVNGAMRHLLAWWMGEDSDPDSGGGLSHLTKAMASLAVLRDAQLHGAAADDRPPASPPELIAEITAAYAAMVPAAQAKAAALAGEVEAKAFIPKQERSTRF